MADQQEELEVLIARAAMADRSAFHALYVATAPRVYAVLMVMLRDQETAQDVLQDTYVKVWGRAGEYHSERGEVLSWVIAIARYRALDLLRASKRRTNFEHQAGETLELSLPTSDAFSELTKECLNRLADIQRRSIISSFVHGFTHEELAVREETPIGTIKSRIRRGLQRLRECLEQ
ncbi:MAG: sigma-70 family RNA polymerase sigma factor [Halioglobus sp.]|nr:sigma-70 family RNA polymerase sigma factor [Halioglobus sp.]